MREDVLRACYDAHDRELAYLLEVARRLEPLFPAGVADVPSGMALLYALQTVSITFDDGFVINDLGDLGKTIGVIEATAVVATLDASGRSPEWWSDQRFAAAATEGESRVYDEIIAKLSTLRHVTEVR
jgi:hypothetical protein